MKRRIMWAAAAVAMLVVGFPGPARAATISTLFNTGVDAGGNSLTNGTHPDPHYSLVSVPAGANSETLVGTSASGTFPLNGAYQLGDRPNSTWIGPNNIIPGSTYFSSPVGLFDYQTTFDLTGLDPTTASISGGWSSDNNGIRILLNGFDIGATPTFNQFTLNSFAGFSIPTSFGHFNAGSNRLDFIIENVDNLSPTALRVEMTGTADTAPPSAVPEPASLIVFGAFGALGFFGYGWKRRHQAT